MNPQEILLEVGVSEKVSVQEDKRRERVKKKRVGSWLMLL